MSTYLSGGSPSIHRSTLPPMHQSIHRSVSPSIYLYIYLFLYVSVCLVLHVSICVCVSLFAYPSVDLILSVSVTYLHTSMAPLCIFISIYRSMDLSIYPYPIWPIYLSRYLSVCPSVCLSVVPICVSAYLSVCPSMQPSFCLSTYPSASLPLYLCIFLCSPRRVTSKNLWASKGFWGYGSFWPTHLFTVSSFHYGGCWGSVSASMMRG